jgi:hypothetical protein
MKTLITLIIFFCLSSGTKKENIDHIEVMYYRYLPDKDLKKADCIWYASIDRFGRAECYSRLRSQNAQLFGTDISKTTIRHWSRNTASPQQAGRPDLKSAMVRIRILYKNGEDINYCFLPDLEDQESPFLKLFQELSRNIADQQYYTTTTIKKSQQLAAKADQYGVFAMEKDGANSKP